jgi:hypothetical protein
MELPGGKRDGQNDQRGGDDPYEFPTIHKKLNPKSQYRNSK